MRVSSTETLIAYSYNTVLTLDRVDLWHSMPHLGLSSAIQKPNFQELSVITIAVIPGSIAVSHQLSIRR